MVAIRRIPKVTRRRLTADEVERMVDAGILDEDDHVELLDGELVQMAAMGGPHVMCVARLNVWFVPRVVERAIVLVQSAFRLTTFSAPEPDLVLVKYRADYYNGSLPEANDVLLIIEVSHSTLLHDRNRKVPLYAAAGIPEVWIIDLNRAQILVYRNPTPAGYAETTTCTYGASLSPLAFPDLELRWEDVFGQP